MFRLTLKIIPCGVLKYMTRNQTFKDHTNIIYYSPIRNWTDEFEYANCSRV